MKRNCLLILSIALMHGLSSPLFADGPERPEENVLRPLLVNLYVGPVGGIGYNFHLGKFTTQCDCEYSGGNGFGPLGGLYVEYPLDKAWSLYGGVNYSDLRADFTRSETRLEFANNGEFVNINFERTAEVTLSYIGLDMNAKWRTGVSTIYLAGGPTIGFLTSNHHLKETERVVTPGFVYQSNSTNQQTFMDQALPDKQSLRIAMHVGAGYDYYATPTFVLSPELGLHLPITSVSTVYNNWRAAALTFSLFIKFGL